jgi:hypothetical protein
VLSGVAGELRTQRCKFLLAWIVGLPSCVGMTYALEPLIYGGAQTLLSVFS